MKQEELRKALDEGDKEKLEGLREQLLNFCSTNLERFVSGGPINVPHAIMASTYGYTASLPEEKISKDEREFRIETLHIFMKRHGVTMYNDMKEAVPGDVIEIKKKNGNETYIIDKINKNKFELTRTSTSFEECRGNHATISMNSKKILFGLHRSENKKNVGFAFFFFYRKQF